MPNLFINCNLWVCPSIMGIIHKVIGHIDLGNLDDFCSGGVLQSCEHHPSYFPYPSCSDKQASELLYDGTPSP